MRYEKLAIPDVVLLAPRVFGDDRGFFMESFNQRVFEDVTGVPATFVQDNHSRSSRGVLRGLHFQLHQPQGKLVRVVAGEVLDVAVDVRPRSATLGHWVSARLSADNHRQLWVPPGFAHGFVVFSDVAELLYKTSDYYAPEYERAIRWDDPALSIDWCRDQWAWSGEPTLSRKDQDALSWHAALREIRAVDGRA